MQRLLSGETMYVWGVTLRDRRPEYLRKIIFLIEKNYYVNCSRSLYLILICIFKSCLWFF